MSNAIEELKNRDSIQFCSFIIGDGFFAVPVLDVQEIIKPQPVTPVPLADECIRGLINLRGQIVTAISLRTLFGLEDNLDDEHMNLIVRAEDGLYSLVVDEICDVITIDKKYYSSPPETLSAKEKEYIDGVYKMDGKLLISLDLAKILDSTNED